MPTTIIMPQLGESVAEGVIGKWLKNEGDQVGKDEPIVEVITDKVNAEIPSPVSGILQRITHPEGATVAVGREIAIIDDDGSGSERGDEWQGAESTPTPAGSTEGRTNEGPGWMEPPSAPAPTMEGDGRRDRVRSSPLVRRLAEQYGVSLAEVPGTGLGGRVSKQDIMSFIERQSAPAAVATEARPHFAGTDVFDREPRAVVAAPPAPPRPASDRVAGPDEELIPVSPLRKMIADRMVQSTTSIPHATTIVEVDMTNVVRYRESKNDEFRRREGAPLSYVAFVLKATVDALKAYPMVNAEWAGDSIVLKKAININIAVDAPDGLTTPVIHGADGKSLAGLSRAVQDLAARAREKKLRLEDMQGGTFTVNNTGALGSVSGVSIINYPQGGILAAAAIVKRPVVLEQQGQDLIAVRSMMNLSFSFDHRLMDGGYASGFVNTVKQKLEAWSPDFPLY